MPTCASQTCDDWSILTTSCGRLHEAPTQIDRQRFDLIGFEKAPLSHAGANIDVVFALEIGQQPDGAKAMLDR